MVDIYLHVRDLVFGNASVGNDGFIPRQRDAYVTGGVALQIQRRLWYVGLRESIRMILTSR